MVKLSKETHLEMFTKMERIRLTLKKVTMVLTVSLVVVTLLL